MKLKLHQIGLYNLIRYPTIYVIPLCICYTIMYAKYMHV